MQLNMEVNLCNAVMSRILQCKSLRPEMRAQTSRLDQQVQCIVTYQTADIVYTFLSIMTFYA